MYLAPARKWRDVVPRKSRAWRTVLPKPTKRKPLPCWCAPMERRRWSSRDRRSRNTPKPCDWWAGNRRSRSSTCTPIADDLARFKLGLRDGMLVTLFELQPDAFPTNNFAKDRSSLLIERTAGYADGCSVAFRTHMPTGADRVRGASARRMIPCPFLSLLPPSRSLKR